MESNDNNVAFLGLGIMGGSMAANLAKKGGLKVSVWNRTPGKPGEANAISAGAVRVETIQQAVKGAGVVFTCLTGGDDVREVLLRSGALDALDSGALVVDMSTIGPRAAIEIHTELAKHGVSFIDAPVTGGDVGAKEGTLTVMVGGSETDYWRAMPMLKWIGRKIECVGPIGSGQKMKLINQILVAINTLAMAEAVYLSKMIGVNPSKTVSVCGSGAASSWALNNLGPKAIANDFAPGFRIRDLVKDLRLAIELLEDSSIHLPIYKASLARFEGAMGLRSGAGAELGTQAVIDLYL